MDPKSFLVAVLLLGTILLRAPTAYSCVSFKASLVEDGVGPYPLSGSLTDNGNQVCSMDGFADPNDGWFYFTCQSGYSTVFDISNSWVTYVPPWNTFNILTTYSDPYWTACVFGCSSC